MDGRARPRHAAAPRRPGRRRARRLRLSGDQPSPSPSCPPSRAGRASRPPRSATELVRRGRARGEAGRGGARRPAVRQRAQRCPLGGEAVSHRSSPSPQPLPGRPPAIVDLALSKAAHPWPDRSGQAAPANNARRMGAASIRPPPHRPRHFTTLAGTMIAMGNAKGAALAFIEGVAASSSTRSPPRRRRSSTTRAARPHRAASPRPSDRVRRGRRLRRAHDDLDERHRPGGRRLTARAAGIEGERGAAAA